MKRPSKKLAEAMGIFDALSPEDQDAIRNYARAEMERHGMAMDKPQAA